MVLTFGVELKTPQTNKQHQKLDFHHRGNLMKCKNIFTPIIHTVIVYQLNASFKFIQYIQPSVKGKW